jgi:hypothetical protein
VDSGKVQNSEKRNWSRKPRRIGKNGGIADPWALFIYALKAPATKEKYIQRLTKFLDFLGYEGSKEEKARADLNYGFNCVLKFFQMKREQIDRKETIGLHRDCMGTLPQTWC